MVPIGRKRKFGKRKRANKRSFRKKRKQRKYTSSLITVPRGKGLTFFADRFKCRLKYVFNETLNPGAGLTVVRIFRGNGAWDPLYAVGGSSPTGWAQAAGLYQRYRCFGSSIMQRATASSGAGAGGASIVFGCVPMNGTLGEPLGLYLDQARGKHKYGNAFYQQETVRNFAKTTVMQGTPDHTAYLPEYASNVANIPASEWFWHTFASCSNQVDALTVRMWTEITYYLEFYMPRTDLGLVDVNNPANPDAGATGTVDVGAYLKGTTGATGAYAIPPQ